MGTGCGGAHSGGQGAAGRVPCGPRGAAAGAGRLHRRAQQLSLQLPRAASLCDRMVHAAAPAAVLAHGRQAGVAREAVDADAGVVDCRDAERSSSRLLSAAAEWHC